MPSISSVRTKLSVINSDITDLLQEMNDLQKELESSLQKQSQKDHIIMQQQMQIDQLKKDVQEQKSQKFALLQRQKSLESQLTLDSPKKFSGTMKQDSH